VSFQEVVHSACGRRGFSGVSLIWRKGEMLGARFVTAKELRQGFVQADEGDPSLAKVPTAETF
jgi:hypothetical protein